MEPTLDPVAQWYREQSDRPLGDAQLASGRTLAPFSRALLKGAGNLLVKAIEALETGDEGRASHLVHRAVGLPFDEHEEVAPAAMAASHLLFTLVTNELEDSEDDDERWLDATLEVLDHADGFTRPDVRDVLTAIAQDYDLTSREQRRLQAGIRDIEPAPELIEQNLSPTELAERVGGIIRACRLFITAAGGLSRSLPVPSDPGQRLQGGPQHP